MSRQHQIEREEQALSKDYAEGRISRDEYNEVMRDLQREAQEAYRQDQEDALERVREDWGAW